MKTTITALIVFASLNSFSENSARPYDQLKQMFDSGSAPASIASIQDEFSEITACAGSAQELPNEIKYFARPIKLTYSKGGFGPSFPVETVNVIAFNSTSEFISIASSSDFNLYFEDLTSQGLKLRTISYYSEKDICYKDTDGTRQCYNDRKTTKFSNYEIRVTENFIVYYNNNTYAYCWK